MKVEELIEGLNELSLDDKIKVLKTAKINIVDSISEEKAAIIYNMFYNEKTNYISLEGLDFKACKCNVDFSHMKVDGHLYQNYQLVEGSLWQDYQDAGASLFQDNQNVGRTLWQHNQNVKGDLVQNKQNVGGNLYQYGCYVGGDLDQSCQAVIGCFKAQHLADDKEYDIKNNETFIVKKGIEMTQEEIEKKLGYRIIIKENKGEISKEDNTGGKEND